MKLRMLAAVTLSALLASRVFAGDACESSGEPTLGVIAGGALVYVSNAPWDAYGQAGALRAGAPVARTVIRRLPL